MTNKTINPFLDAEGRPVDPSHHGFTWEDTGGGCTLWVLETGEGDFYVGGATHETVHEPTPADWSMWKTAPGEPTDVEWVVGCAACCPFHHGGGGMIEIKHHGLCPRCERTCEAHANLLTTTGDGGHTR